MSQSSMIYGWCQRQHFTSGGGNWQDGYWCWKPVQGQVTQTVSPGYMCDTLIEPAVSFHIILPVESKNGACGYWV